MMIGGHETVSEVAVRIWRPDLKASALHDP